MSPIALIGAGAVILLIGAGIGFLLGSVKGRRESARAEDLQTELSAYRRDVTAHFGETAAHFRAIGAEYRKLYEHMASGEAALCDAGQGIAFKPSELLTESTGEDEEPQPRDYDAAGSAEEDSELPEIVAGERTRDPMPDIEPTDAELAETESVEEMIADHEIVTGGTEAGKTIH